MPIIKLQGESEKRNRIFYQLNSDDQPIGVGGMGQVFKGLCINEITGASRPVAIKFMYEDLPPHAIERARREASIQLRNDNLIEMLGFFEIDETTPLGENRKRYHVVSELLDGVSLADLLEGKTKNYHGEDVPFAVNMLREYNNNPEHFAQIIAINILSGLMALHDAGYLHRDIDPSNIMLTSDGHIKLIDFGIAKKKHSLTSGDKSLTVAGIFMGKPEYAAPELVLGDISHQDQTTDIYSVGILLYQCILGHTPFEGAKHVILEKQIKEKLPLKQVKNTALRRIIATACEKRQEQRFQTAAQMRAALETKNSSQLPNSSNGRWMILAIAVTAFLLGFYYYSHNESITKTVSSNQELGLASIEQKEQKESLNTVSVTEEDEKSSNDKLDNHKAKPKPEQKTVQQADISSPTKEVAGEMNSEKDQNKNFDKFDNTRVQNLETKTETQMPKNGHNEHTSEHLLNQIVSQLNTLKDINEKDHKEAVKKSKSCTDNVKQLLSQLKTKVSEQEVQAIESIEKLIGGDAFDCKKNIWPKGSNPKSYVIAPKTQAVIGKEILPKVEEIKNKQ